MGSFQKKCIWVVEDDESIQEVLKIILEQEGYTVIAIMNEHELKQQREKTLPHLILLDLNFSKNDGVMLAQSLKTTQNLRNVPILLLSADIDIERKFKESGADGFIKKPFEMVQFLQEVRKYLH